MNQPHPIDRYMQLVPQRDKLIDGITDNIPQLIELIFKQKQILAELDDPEFEHTVTKINQQLDEILRLSSDVTHLNQ